MKRDAAILADIPWMGGGGGGGGDDDESDGLDDWLSQLKGDGGSRRKKKIERPDVDFSKLFPSTDDPEVMSDPITKEFLLVCFFLMFLFHT